MSRSAALLLVAGVVSYAVAVIAAEPFEQPDAETLYRSVRDGVGRYRLVNGLATGGLALVVAGSAGLVRTTAGPRAGLRKAGFGLLLVASVLWLVEVTVRVTRVVHTAANVGRGDPLPRSVAGRLGVGLEPLFVCFVLAALAAIVLLLLGLQDARQVGGWGAVAALAALASGLIATLTYPSAGAVERVLFYPLVVGLLPVAGRMCFPSRQAGGCPSATD